MASPAGQFPDEGDDEQPGLTIRPLSHADLDAILAHLEQDRDSLLAGTAADRPVVALRVRATVGRPGASAHAAYQARRAVELAGCAACPGAWPSRSAPVWPPGYSLPGWACSPVWPPRAWPAGRCGFAPARRPGRGGAVRPESAEPPGC
jgi:hypothetical protein